VFRTVLKLCHTETDGAEKSVVYKTKDKVRSLANATPIFVFDISGI
jgi:hypothetical protein